MYSLALSDLLSSLIWPFSAAIDVTHHNKQVGKLWIQMCFVKEFIIFIAGISNMLNYLLVTIDRFILINYALKYKIVCTKKRLKYAVFGIWLSASIIDGMEFGLMSNNEVEKYGCYQSHVLSSTGYYCVVAGAVACTIIILILYTIIILNLIRRDKNQHTIGTSNQMVASKVTKALALVVGVYIGLYIPTFFIGIATIFLTETFMHILYDVSNMCFYLNNCLNIFIYYNRMPDFKIQFLEILKIDKQKESTHNQNNITFINTQNRQI